MNQHCADCVGTPSFPMGVSGGGGGWAGALASVTGVGDGVYATTQLG